jgi:hypothetical protein
MESNLPQRKLKHKRCDFLQDLDSSCRAREMIQKHDSVQQRMTRAMNKLGDLWEY